MTQSSLAVAFSQWSCGRLLQATLKYMVLFRHARLYTSLAGFAWFGVTTLIAANASRLWKSTTSYKSKICASLTPQRPSRACVMQMCKQIQQHRPMQHSCVKNLQGPGFACVWADCHIQDLFKDSARVNLCRIAPIQICARVQIWRGFCQDRHAKVSIAHMHTDFQIYKNL